MRLVSIPPPYGPPHSHGPQDPSGQYPAGPPPGAQPPPQYPYGAQPGFAPYGLYGPYGPRPPVAVNGVAIAALVLGLLCFVPAVGLVLGLIALRQIKRRGERGRGMAVAGAVLSSAGLALWTLMLATGAAADFWEGVKEGARAESVLALRAGDCFNSPTGLEGWADEATKVPCARKHDGEVFALVTLPGGAYPGEDSLTGTADERCYDLVDGYVMDRWALPDTVDVYYYLPTEDSWRFGDRGITCVLGERDGRSPLTGSLRRDETTLDAHQLAYLEAAGVLNAALDDHPGTEFAEDDLPGHTAWADEVATALAEQTRMLRAHTWPAGAQTPLDELADGLAEAEKEWVRAAEATDADTYYAHSDRGLTLIDPRQSVTARKALGLATSPPRHEEERGEAPESGDMKV
ncbi:membrane protein [Streptomyces pilosus]|uniref:Membrane protein n=1 Tax=Streptomyces pilosus TaxID=28893 RepID=A0A918F0L5_9ACTN|nr:membrane protein [Streptomyces pilosus]